MKTVIITGSSRGIGKAAALRFAKEGGWNLVLNCSRSIEALKDTENVIRTYPNTKVMSVTGDVSDENVVKEMFRKSREAFGNVDVVVNNAGIDYFGLIQDMDVQDWDRIMNVNVRSVFLCTREAIPQMLVRHSGSIVNVSSVWGTVGGSCEAAYSASKGAVAAFSKACARELGTSGIRVNALAFGAIDTSMNDRLNAEEKGALADEIALGRMGAPEEAAELIYQTAVLSTYLTGQVITMDGGWV